MRDGGAVECAVREANTALPQSPMLFGMAPASLVGDRAALMCTTPDDLEFGLSEAYVDPEPQLVAVMGLGAVPPVMRQATTSRSACGDRSSLAAMVMFSRHIPTAREAIRVRMSQEPLQVRTPELILPG